MQITYNDKTIDFFKFPVEQVVIALSGGTDSAAVMFLICKHFPNVEVIPYSCQDVYNPYDIQAAEKIVKFMQDKFPSQNIQDLIKRNYDDRNEALYPAAEEAIKNDPSFSTMTAQQVSKSLQLSAVRDELRNRYPNAYMINGMTRNPPIEDMKKHPIMFHMAETRRNQNDKQRNTRGPRRSYLPFANVDKKFVAAVFKENNLMDSLFPLTRSCVGDEEMTDNYSQECHECFWCFEKAWAFDLKWE